MKNKQLVISIPGAGYFVLAGTKSSKCYRTLGAAKAARTRGARLSHLPLK